MTEFDHELTERIQQKICEALRFGASYELAARYAGIEMKWFWRWKKDGEHDQAVGNEDYRQKCIAFSKDIKKARTDYKAGCLLKMELLGGTQWKPLQWKYLQLLALELRGQRNREKNE